MPFHADLHIHSKHSRATSRDLDLENLAWWARRKGISVVGTGDFTHPAWIAELKEKLVPAEPGLFRLRDEVEQGITGKLPAACQTPVRFMLSVEISTIYKKGPLTRKIHHLLYAPDIDTAERINARLARIGNITADGRPILGLDSRDLLEIALEVNPQAYLVPAHIWTPWFAVLGSKAGFDSIDECYRDLADHVFALETGLSSDPAMNWRLSQLDRYRLVSNSDAHSPGKLGRETTLFDCDMDYFSIRKALETGDGYVGTVEFFPEEGKYHLDGHRKCGIRLTPEQSAENDNRCPVCGQPLTIGVLNRIETLADRGEAEVTPPATAGEVTSLVPLSEVLSEIESCGPSSKAVTRHYDRLIATLGAELEILRTIPIEDVARADSSLLAEAITRLRAGQVIRDAGYDGEYGVIRLFEEHELRKLARGGVLFDMGTTRPEKPPTQASTPKANAIESATVLSSPRESQGLDAEQRAAVETVEGPLLIVAGPGSGKTRTLTHRIAHLIGKHEVPAEQCLAITFTRRAALEMKARLAGMLPGETERIRVHTFHSLGLDILRAQPQSAGLQRGFQVASEEERSTALAEALQISTRKSSSLLRAISKAKRAQQPASAEMAAVIHAYQQMLTFRNWIDFDDLIGLTVQTLSADPGLATHYRDLYRWISVDEFQDVDEQQYRLLTLLAPPPQANLCVIGDPDQAIYGFRGADSACFERFKRDYPDATAILLKRNYRSSGTIVTAASQVIASTGDEPFAEVVREMHERIAIHAAPTEKAEAEFVIQTIERLIGGHSFFSIDSGRSTGNAADNLSVADFAVLYRTNAQGAALREAFERSGMPFKQHGHEAYLERPESESDEDVIRAKVPSIDSFDSKADRVSLLTLHAAKGLEFPVVFIVGLEDSVLPLYWSSPDESALAEERRLFYVGMTRAKDRLILTRTLKRHWRGRLQTLNASPFLKDIESELLKHQQVKRPPPKPADPQLSLL
jgi:DNA helicase-2/ATP-dependent DNA helicase PcrA